MTTHAFFVHVRSRDGSLDNAPLFMADSSDEALAKATAHLQAEGLGGADGWTADNWVQVPDDRMAAAIMGKLALKDIAPSGFPKRHKGFFHHRRANA